VLPIRFRYRTFPIYVMPASLAPHSKESAQEVVLLSWQQNGAPHEGAPHLGNHTVWQVMQTEGLLGQLQEAIEESNAPEAHKLLQDSHAAYNQLKARGGAHLLESGHYDTAGRERVCDKFVGQFGRLAPMDTPESVADNLMAYDPFHSVTPYVAPPAPEAPQAVAQPQPVTTKVLDPTLSLLNAMDNTQLCRKSTSDVMGTKPLKNSSRKNAPQQSRTVLQLRGGGWTDDCNGQYGSCGASLCGSLSKEKKDKKLKAAKKAAGKAHERVKDSLASTVNAFLDQPFIALGLVSIDLFSDLINMVIPWEPFYWIGLVALLLVILQQILEIYLHSSLVQKEILEEDTVIAIISFWADDGENNPIRIEVGQTALVDAINIDADWRVDNGAFLTFDGMDHSVFVSSRDYMDLEVTSGLYEYFANPFNIFQCIILLLVFIFAINVIPSGGLGPFLIALRFLKPVLRLYARKNKMEEFHHSTGRASGHEHGEHGEHGEHEGA